MPEEFDTLRRLMEARMLKIGRRGYVRVLWLVESFGMEELHAAGKQALKMGALGFYAKSKSVPHGSSLTCTPTCHGRRSRRPPQPATCP